MPQMIGVTKAITNLNEVHNTLNLQPAVDPDFFTEWVGSFPELSLREIEICDRLRTRYRYYQSEGAITESTVNLIMISPLLDLLGLYDPPHLIRGEKYIKLEIEDKDQILEGLIDILVLRDRIWLILLETKRYGFSVLQALPQTLAYMMANPGNTSIAYGLITTGEDYLFVKLDLQRNQYDVSDKFTLSTRHTNQLYNVVQVLKQLLLP
jgi:hypothetical protein